MEIELKFRRGGEKWCVKVRIRLGLRNNKVTRSEVSLLIWLLLQLVCEGTYG
jgi:hypothetical protein